MNNAPDYFQEAPNYFQEDTKSSSGNTVMQDVVSGFTDIPSYLWEGIKSIPQAAPELYGAATGGFQRLGQNALAGLGKLGHNLLSSPGNIRDYAAKHNESADNLPSFRLPESILPREYDYAKGVGLEDQRRGDALVQGTFERLPSVLARKNPFMLALSEAMNAVGHNENPITAGFAPSAAKGAVKGLNSAPVRNAARNAASSAANLAREGAQGISNRVGNTWDALHPERLAETIVEGRRNVNQASREGYRGLMREAAREGIRTEVPPIDIQTIVEGASRKQVSTLRDYIENGSVENAHAAYKDMGKLIRDLTKRDRKSGLLGPDRNVLDSAIDAQNSIREQMFKAFQDAGRPDLSNRFQELNHQHITRVMPHNNPLIMEHIRGDSTSSDFLKGLGKNKAFKARLGEEYPAVGTRAALPLAAKMGLGAGAAYYGLPKILRALKDDK